MSSAVANLVREMIVELMVKQLLSEWSAVLLIKMFRWQINSLSLVEPHQLWPLEGSLAPLGTPKNVLFGLFMSRGNCSYKQGLLNCEQTCSLFVRSHCPHRKARTVNSANKRNRANSSHCTNSANGSFFKIVEWEEQCEYCSVEHAYKSRFLPLESPGFRR